MNNRPVNVSNVDANKIKFVVGPSKEGRNPSISLKYENGQNLEVMIPKLAFPGGVNTRVDPATKKVSYTMMGTLKDCDPYAVERCTANTEVAAFYNLLLDLERLIVDNAVENSVKWFGKKRSREAVLDGWKRILGVSSTKEDGVYVPNGKYPPSLRIKIPVYDDSVKTDVVDSQRNDLYVTPDSLTSIFPKGVVCNVVLGASIYIMSGGGFGVTWRLQHAQTLPSTKLTAADIFAVEDVEYDEDAVAALTPSQETGVVDSAGGVVERPTTPDDQPIQPGGVPAAPARKRRTAVTQ